MVKVKGPLFSLEAHGSLADCLTYQDINNDQCVKSLRFPTYRRSDAQALVRDTFSWAAASFFRLHCSKRTKWKEFTDYKGLTGYASFMHYMLKRTYLPAWQFAIPPDTGWCISGNEVTAEFLVGGGHIPPLYPFSDLTPPEDIPVIAQATILWNALHLVKQLTWETLKPWACQSALSYFVECFINRTRRNIFQYETLPDNGFCLTGNHDTGDFLVGGEYILPAT